MPLETDNEKGYLTVRKKTVPIPSTTMEKIEKAALKRGIAPTSLINTILYNFTQAEENSEPSKTNKI